MLYINEQLASGLVSGDAEEVTGMIHRLFKAHGAKFLYAAVLADLCAEKEAVFDKYVPYFDVPEAVPHLLRLFKRLYYEKEQGGYVMGAVPMMGKAYRAIVTRLVCKTLDPRWIELLTNEEGPFWKYRFAHRPLKEHIDGWNRDLTMLVNPDDEKIVEVLRSYFLRSVRRGEDSECFRGLLLCGWTNFDRMLPLYFSRVDGVFHYHWVTRLYEMLPIETPQIIKELKEIADMIDHGAIYDIHHSGAAALRSLAHGLSEGKTIGEIRAPGNVC